jgi:hypothetical protein
MQPFARLASCLFGTLVELFESLQRSPVLIFQPGRSKSLCLCFLLLFLPLFVNFSSLPCLLMLLLFVQSSCTLELLVLSFFLSFCDSALRYFTTSRASASLTFLEDQNTALP